MIYFSNKVVFFLNIAALLVQLQLSTAFPTYAGSCIGGQAAVGGPHLTANETVGASLGDIYAEVLVGGNAYRATSRIPLLPGVAYKIAVNIVNADAYFRGILIRLEGLAGQDMTAALLSGTNVAPSEECDRTASVIGVSHFNRDNKKTADATFLIDQPGVIAMDITVVVGNDPQVSLYGFDTFTLEIADVPASAPSATPETPSTLPPRPTSGSGKPSTFPAPSSAPDVFSTSPPTSTFSPTSSFGPTTSFQPTSTFQPTSSFQPTTTPTVSLKPSTSSPTVSLAPITNAPSQVLLPTTLTPTSPGPTTIAPTMPPVLSATPTLRPTFPPVPAVTTTGPVLTDVPVPASRRRDPAPSEKKIINPQRRREKSSLHTLRNHIFNRRFMD